MNEITPFYRPVKANDAFDNNKSQQKPNPDLCERVGLLCCTLSLTGGVTEGEDDGPLVVGAHAADHLLCESSGHGCRSLGTL